ncbi:ring finger domain containing protein [Nitzschia inconspicua]|uniref:Ring finger domain containing protein n=1 Tax=Nitzschia inconspicua TaxID=303405 RepID=A0A9K3LVB1_9STRA|nr:ring finger domain containing protein [Nitzschia inconspicua]
MTSTQSWYLLYPSSSSSASSSKDVGTLYASCTHLVWVTVAGMLGLRICTNAIRFYYFCIDWNLITKKEWADLAAMHFFKQNYVSRKMQIMDALVTTTWSTKRGDGSECKNESTSKNQHDDVDATIRPNMQNGSTTCNITAESNEPTRPLQCECTSCPICLSEFQELEKLCYSKDIDSCSHVFHAKCLQAWLLKHTSCPVCRYEMVSPTNLPPSFEARMPTLSASSRQ